MPFMSAPRSAPRLLVGTFELYRRYPLLFLVLAAGVIVPYELIALAATGTGSFSRANASVGVQLFLSLADLGAGHAAGFGPARSRCLGGKK
jgi:hypothetical protein